MENCKNENIVCCTISPPTYLKELYVEDEDIILVHVKGDPIEEELISPKKVESLQVETNDTMDLTGNPLEVDLNGDESQLSAGLTHNIHLWTEEEETHFPMDLRRARQYINQQIRIKKCEGESFKPIYVVTDGKNMESTVAIGVQKTDKFLMTTKVNILGYLSKDNEDLTLEKMVKHHMLNTRLKDCKINYVSKFRYYLYGTFLQKIKNLHELEIYGSICIETISNNKCSYNSLQNSLNTKNMMLQIIVGHPLSSVHFLWEDLCLLQKYLDILSSTTRYNDPETLLSRDPLEVPDVYKQISGAIGFNFLKKEAKMSFSLNNIRVENILDKLWNILKRCENLSDLRESFHYLFEELTETQTNLKISEKDCSNIATIVSGILNGNLAVPTITFSQALDFLFELGAEKLKKDYQTIIKNFYSSSESAISAKWSQLKNKLSLQDGFRKTRITVNPKPGKTELNQNVAKLTYLGKLHVAVEFIYLVRTGSGLPDETFDYLCERVCKSYVENESTSTSDFYDLQNSQICNYETVVEVPEKKMIKSDVPTTWSMKMTSLNNDMEITTIYHLCQHPIFPATIFNNYDTSTETKEDCDQFYVTKLERYKSFLQ